MHEMVTMKRKTYSGLQVVLSGLACGLLGFLCYWVIVRYGRGKFYGTDSGAASFGWLLLSFLVVVLFMQSISLFFGLLIRVITDRVPYVTVRKSSMENRAAAEIYRRYRRKMMRIAVFSELFTDVIFAIAVVAFAASKNTSKGTYWLVLIALLLVTMMNPVPRMQKNKAVDEVRRIFTEDCDPVMAFDIYEHSRLGYMRKVEKDATFLQQASHCYYMGDYPEMARCLSACGNYLYGENKVIYIYLKGLYAIDQNQMDQFYVCSGELGVIEQKRGLSVQEKNRAEKTRREWRIRLELVNGDPVQLIPVIQRLLTEEKEHIRWMDRTFQLAWLQLKTGDRERAMENLRLVAGRAGTMAIRKKAEELLKA